MNTQATTELHPHVAIINGEIKTTSMKIAEHFGKRHADVLRAVEKLECSPEFTERNFALSKYKDSSGKANPFYEITRDGFTFLVMGFTGKQAAQWKEAYIKAFNEMERRLQKQTPAWKSSITRKAKAEDQPLPKTIQAAINRRAQTLSRRHYDDYHVVLQRMARWMMDNFDLKGEDLIEALNQEDLGWVGYPAQEGKAEKEKSQLALKPDCPKYHYPISDWHLENRVGVNDWLTYQELNRGEPAFSPLNRLLRQLKADGHDVDGALAEFRAHKTLVDNFYCQLNTLRKVFDSTDRIGHNIIFT